ncbi:MAG TPA: YajQ family cyclic di-GMP-binding protein [Legionellales bacterium]|nr:YajQ family cyclic di-GMP-binding protein [Legionellales bacterium]
MPSFDIVCELDQVNLRHVVDNTQREVTNRFDFKGISATAELKEKTVTLTTESDFQVQQMEGVFRAQCARLHLNLTGVDFPEEPEHSGKFYSLKVEFKEGIDQDCAKKITKFLKESKLKIQSSIQGDKVRVTGKSRDDLQETIALLKQQEFDRPLQFNNFRD